MLMPAQDLPVKIIAILEVTFEEAQKAIAFAIKVGYQPSEAFLMDLKCCKIMIKIMEPIKITKDSINLVGSSIRVTIIEPFVAFNETIEITIVAIN